MFDVSKCQGQKFINGKYQLPAECDGAPQGYEQTPVPVGKKPGKTPAPAKPKPHHKAQHADFGIFKVAQSSKSDDFDLKDRGIDPGDKTPTKKPEVYDYKGPSPQPYPGDPVDSPKTKEAPKKPEHKKHLIG